MTYDNENIELSQKLKSRTIRAAGVALHKKRFRIITASSLAAVVCAAAAVFFTLGSEPVPDVVLDSSVPTSAVSIEGLYANGAIDEETALNYARQRHVRIYKLSKPESSSPTEINFSENGTFVTLLNYENIAQELAEYGFSFEPPSEKLNEDYLYYMVAFHSPSYQYRYVHLGIQFTDDGNYFKYISIDNDPVISGEYGLSRPADDGATNIGYLVTMPSSMKDTPLAAKKVLWSDLTDEEKTEAVIDTVLLNDDVNEILGSGVENSLTYELAILKKIGLPAINHLRQYYSASVVGNLGMNVAQYMLYSLLNDFQLENYDLTDPEQAIKKWFLSYVLSLDYESKTPDCLIIPEVYVTEQNFSQTDSKITGCASVYSYKPPMILEERNLLFEAGLSQNSDREWEIQNMDIVNWYGNMSEDEREKYSGILDETDLDEIRNEQYNSAQALYDELTSYIQYTSETNPEDYYRIDSNTEQTRSFISIPLTAEPGNKKADALFGSDSQPVIISTDDYMTIFDEYGLTPDDLCHSDASAKLKDFSNDVEYFDTYIVLFPAASKKTRYDEVMLGIQKNQIALSYASRSELFLSVIKPPVKGFLVAVAKELECETFSAQKVNWEGIQQEYKIDMLIDILLTKPGEEYDLRRPYQICPEHSGEIKEIFDMMGPATHILRDMRYAMDLSSSIINPNKESLVDGLLNMMVQHSVESNLDNNTVEYAIKQYLYRYYEETGSQPINTCLLFDFYFCHTDHSDFGNGYATYYMMVYEDRIISMHENAPIYFPAKIKVKVNDEDETWEVVSFEKAETEEETRSLFGRYADSYFSSLGTEETMFLSRHTKDYFCLMLGEGSIYDQNASNKDFDNPINQFLIKDYDTGIPEEAIKAKLLSWALEDESFFHIYPIIPEIHVFKQNVTTDNNGKTTISVYGYAGIYAFVPPYAPEQHYRAFYAELSETVGSGIRWYDVYELKLAETEGEINKTMGEFADDAKNIGKTSVKSEMFSQAMEEYNYLINEFPEALSLEEDPVDQPPEKISGENFGYIKEFMLSRHEEAHDPYSAIGRDLITHILGADEGDDVLQITTISPLSEDFDNPITVAVLAATYDGSETESEHAKLYVVTAEYDEATWELKDIQVEEKVHLSMSEYPKLKYRGARAVYYSLYTNLVSRVKDIGSEVGLSLPAPLMQKNISGNILNLGFARGTPQFASVSRLIYPEEDAGVTSYIWYVEEEPVWLCDDARLDALKNAEWEEITEPTEKNTAGYSVSTPGLVGIAFEVHVENETSLYKAHFTIDAQTRFTTLWLSEYGGGSAYYKSYDTAIYNAMVDVFGIDTDVSEFMITDEKGPALPDYREELKYLTPIVGDMPGGIMSVEATELSSLSVDTGSYENTSVISDETALIEWALQVGEILESCEINDLGGGLIDTIAPTAIWQVMLAPQEGIGTLKISGYGDSGSIIIAKTYRMYGRTDTLYTIYQLNSFELFDSLCEMSFGETLRD